MRTEEPYIAICFEKQDKKRVMPIIKELYKRGIRTKYCDGFSQVIAKEEEQTQMISNAEVVVIVRSSKSFNSRFIKSTALYYENKEKSIAFIDIDVKESDLLSVGLKSEHKIIDGKKAPSSIVDELTHTENFTQEIFCEPYVANSKTFKLATILVVVAAVIALTLIILFEKGYIIPAASKDSITISDQTISRGARLSIGGKYNTALSQEEVEQLETLYLDKEPSTFSDLSKFKNLKTVVIPDCSKETAEYFLSYGAELLLSGGNAK